MERKAKGSGMQVDNIQKWWNGFQLHYLALSALVTSLILISGYRKMQLCLCVI